MPMRRRKSSFGLVAILLVLGAAFATSSRADKKERVLFSFSGGADGGNPICDLVFDAHGNLYGTTNEGGDFGDGTVFKLTPAAKGYWGEWSETVLHSFHRNGKDGAKPFAGVVFDKGGNLWGTTQVGGANNDGGTVFELSPGANGTWSETVISLEHAQPFGTLIFDKVGNIYGTTRSDPRNMGTGAGTIFKLTRASNGTWSLTTLYAFKKAAYQFMRASPSIDAEMSMAGLIFDAAGNLYGTSWAGGYNTAGSDGTIFILMHGANGTWEEGGLHNFNCNANSGDGCRPMTALIMDAHGNLFGTAGGGTYGSGIVFELSRNAEAKWHETVLHTFNHDIDGSGPQCRMLFDKAGNLYGITWGTVFELSPGPNGIWSETIVHKFSPDGTEGNTPQAGLIFDSQGNLYGTTTRGGGDPGTPGHGVVFEILTGSASEASSDDQTSSPADPPGGADSAVLSNVQVSPPSPQSPARTPAYTPSATPSSALSASASPAPSSATALRAADAVAGAWESDAYAGQTFHFKLDGNAIYVYGDQQQLLGTLQGKEKKGAIDVYQGLVQIPPVTDCPGGTGLMQIKSWNENRLDAKIETPVNTSAGITCGGVLGSGRFIPWQKVTFVKR